MFFFFLADSPGIPASANAHELFRGFSFVAPCLLDESPSPTATDKVSDSFTKVRGKSLILIKHIK